MEQHISEYLSGIPKNHREFILTSVDKLKGDKRILGVAAGGSILSGNMDQFSDLDLVVAVALNQYQTVLNDREGIARSIGPLLAAFTGEHVHEPRLLICLYGPPLLHVDFKFISLSELEDRVEDPLIIWERESALTNSLSNRVAEFPKPNLDWIENRFWVWIHYAASKIGRGELFEAIDHLGFMRSHVLGPMILLKAGARTNGVRRIEEYGASYTKELQRTIPAYTRQGCLHSTNATIDLYRTLRTELNQGRDVVTFSKVESEAVRYLKEIEKEGEVR